MVVEEAVGHGDKGFAVAGWIPGQTEAWGDVVVIARNAFDNAQGFFRGGVDGSGRSEQRSNFHVITDALIQSQLAFNAPGILCEKAEGEIVEGLVGVADALDVRRRNSQTAL